MDSNKKPLFYLDPMCSALNMFADAVTAPHSQDIITVKEAANVDGSDEASDSKKPIKFLASSFAALIKDDDEDRIKEKKRRVLKGKSAAVMNNAKNDDILDQDWVVLKPSPTKLVRSNRKRQRFNLVVEAAPSELPQEFKDKINELGGNEITLLITKSLYDSDLNGQQNRLSIPSKQIENINFLREGELEDLEARKGIEVKLIQPSLEVTNLTSAKWNMRKDNGRISSSYVLRSSSWKQVV